MDEDKTGSGTEEKAPTAWQQTRYHWYDHLNVTVDQINVLLRCCYAALGLTFLAIALDALGVF